MGCYRHDLTERQRRILHFLRDGQPVAASAIHSAIDSGLAKRTIQEELKHLRNLGLIGSSGRGPWARWWLIRNR
jgi:ATP-dependent DNA helicase RecG